MLCKFTSIVNIHNMITKIFILHYFLTVSDQGVWKKNSLNITIERAVIVLLAERRLVIEVSGSGFDSETGSASLSPQKRHLTLISH